MTEGVKQTGIFSRQELMNSPGVPSAKRLEEGPVAYIECTQLIPCDPCEKACPFDAIKIGDSIINLPQLMEEKCNGCGTCIPLCPGLAIFKIHKNYSADTSLVSFPYEYVPLPEKGAEVSCVNRAGEVITRGRVVRVQTSSGYDKTAVVSVEVPKEDCLEVRSIERGKGAGNG